jgi:hypothetical protein
MIADQVLDDMMNDPAKEHLIVRNKHIYLGDD